MIHPLKTTSRAWPRILLSWFAACLLTLAMGPVIDPATLDFVPAPLTVRAQNQWWDNFCIDASANCTANDGSISAIYEGNITSRCEEMPVGRIEGSFILELADPNADRYDYGIYLSEDEDPVVGNDACYVEVLHPIETPGNPADPANPSGMGPFRNLEPNDPADVCGDVEAATPPITAIFQTTGDASLPCYDNNNDGFLDIEWCIAYDNNRQDTCDHVMDLAPGTPAKCGCATEFTDTIPVGSANVEITKETLSQTIDITGSDYTYDAVFEIRVQNTGVRDLEEFALTDNLNGWIPSGSETYTINSASAEIVDSSYAFGAGRGCMLDDNTDTGTMSYDGTSDVRLTLPNTSCLGYASASEELPGDYAVFQIHVNFTTTCAADYTNTATVNTQPDTGINEPTGGQPIIESATSQVACGPLAVDLVDFEARSSDGPGRQGLLAILAALAVAGTALIVRRRDSSSLRHGG